MSTAVRPGLVRQYEQTFGLLLDEVEEAMKALTPRETEILKHLAEGKAKPRTLAVGLGISPKTIDVHRNNIMTKLRAPTNAAMCKFYWFHRLTRG
jgi:DNA-binding CsgD family transcriptional regulator